MDVPAASRHVKALGRNLRGVPRFRRPAIAAAAAAPEVFCSRPGGESCRFPKDPALEEEKAVAYCGRDVSRLLDECWCWFLFDRVSDLVRRQETMQCEADVEFVRADKMMPGKILQATSVSDCFSVSLEYEEFCRHQIFEFVFVCCLDFLRLRWEELLLHDTSRSTRAAGNWHQYSHGQQRHSPSWRGDHSIC